jgi:chromosome transmission fidelity protein 1
MSDVVNQLFSHLPMEKMTSFSCGHIIPEENLQTLVVNKGPGGGDLEFKADKQNNPATVGLYFYLISNAFLNVSNFLNYEYRLLSSARCY